MKCWFATRCKKPDWQQRFEEQNKRKKEEESKKDTYKETE
jgi:hypothetical protein